MKTMRVYRSGLHFGEEKIVSGNERSGMILFSGCHLACSFCYTPEVSFRSVGAVTDAEAFEAIAHSLVERGAKNLNLISPTHVLSSLIAPLTSIRERYGSQLPIVFKTSGYEPYNVVRTMASLADVFVPDFKLVSEDICKSVRMPADYGKVTAGSIAEMSRLIGETQWNREGKMTRGIVVRHLFMPGFERESELVVEKLEQIGYRGPLNFMTNFVNPKTHRLETAPHSWTATMSSMAESAGMSVLINGREQEASAYAIV